MFNPCSLCTYISVKHTSTPSKIVSISCNTYSYVRNKRVDTFIPHMRVHFGKTHQQHQQNHLCFMRHALKCLKCVICPFMPNNEHQITYHINSLCTFILVRQQPKQNIMPHAFTCTIPWQYNFLHIDNVSDRHRSSPILTSTWSVRAFNCPITMSKHALFQ